MNTSLRKVEEWRKINQAKKLLNKKESENEYRDSNVDVSDKQRKSSKPVRYLYKIIIIN